MVIYWAHIKKRGKHKGSNDVGSRREKKEGQAKGNMAKNIRKRETRDGVVKLA